MRRFIFQTQLSNHRLSQARIDTLKKEVCMLLLDLKKLNRVDKIRCRNIRDKVYEVWSLSY